MARLSRQSWLGQVLGGLAAAAAGPELLAGAGGLNLVAAGTYSYRVTYVTAAGETLPAPVPVIARKVYRANARGGPYRLVATITDTRTHYLDGEASP